MYIYIIIFSFSSPVPSLRQALRMMLGLDLVSIHLRNLTLNGLLVPQGEPLFQNGGPTLHLFTHKLRSSEYQVTLHCSLLTHLLRLKYHLLTFKGTKSVDEYDHLIG